ncbi:hypothetical protein [Enterococcus faecalis]|uniref:hypothetical protein n=1 Tax=Enterococcus faecalis TaxID=1351 RepID=UPI00398BE218
MINEVGQKAIKSMFLTENENLNRQPVCEKTKTINHKNANQVSDLELLPFLKKQLDQKDIQLQEKVVAVLAKLKRKRQAKMSCLFT